MHLNIYALLMCISWTHWVTFTCIFNQYRALVLHLTNQHHNEYIYQYKEMNNLLQNNELRV